MIEAVMGFIHNYFVKEKHRGSFTIASNRLSLPFLIAGQYFRIIGSALNDGVYRYPCTNLYDETFSGEVWALAVPRRVLELVSEIEDWQEANGSAADSPYQSESFGGYSYTKGNSSNANGLTGWQAQFASRLNEWRKIS